jgi:hypothetical protein
MTVLDQIQKSRLSKNGQTSITGIFEGTPENVAAVLRGFSAPRSSTQGVFNTKPTDMVVNHPPQPTYLDYLKVTNQI